MIWKNFSLIVVLTVVTIEKQTMMMRTKINEYSTIAWPSASFPPKSLLTMACMEERMPIIACRRSSSAPACAIAQVVSPFGSLDRRFGEDLRHHGAWDTGRGSTRNTDRHH